MNAELTCHFSDCEVEPPMMPVTVFLGQTVFCRKNIFDLFVLKATISI
ncbi:hypothetical protein SAMN05443507_13214 [Alicyclobacillus tolerans]|uniref:Uncharacterized protein n=1 Tax=Alicyclobacillus tolerans TaxID=90970 RepID=A0A1M6X6V2_9BACL|nr:hypothetical protein SAMN05443507_13214 [Alicyclobacillus montanus]